MFCFLALTLDFFSHGVFLSYLKTSFMNLANALRGLLNFLGLTRLNVNSTVKCILCGPLFRQGRRGVGRVVSIVNCLCQYVNVVVLDTKYILTYFLPLVFPSDAAKFSVSLVCFTCFSFLISSLVNCFVGCQRGLLKTSRHGCMIATCFRSTGVVGALVRVSLTCCARDFCL